MDRIAFIYGETFIYWSSVLLALAAVTGVCVFFALYLGKSGNGLGAALTVVLALPASLILARLVHWYCRADSYPSFEAAMTDYRSGGYALMGVFAGCILAACLVRLCRGCKNLPELLDCLALAAGAGIPVGRLASLFNTSDRGMLLEGLTELPIAYASANAVTGATEYRLATFMLQAIVTAAIFGCLLLFWLVDHGRKKLKNGDTALLFLALYGAAQIVLDSTRYDALYFRSNGFVSIVQILGLVAMVAAVAVFSVRLVLARGWKFWYLGLWLGYVAFCGGAGYMEYHVQRHGDQAAFAYSVMSVCLAGAMVLTLVIRLLAVRAERRKGK